MTDTHLAPTTDKRIAVIVSKYNHSITEKLLEGACHTLHAGGIASNKITIVWVPGAWEIPIAASHFAKRDDYAAIVTLGAVIRGETSHDHHINRAVSQALMRLSLMHDIPITFGVLTVNSLEQALQRAGGNAGNKGEEAAQAALDMIRVLATYPVN
jgi:6,7-dimethyl-8-ribityllumazine synthase